MLAVTVFVLALGVIWLTVRLGRLAGELRRLERSHRDLLGRVYELESARRLSEPPPLASPPEPIPAAPAHVAPQPPPARPARDWEAMIGGNWLNKVGALVLVVGIALFLGYSLTHFGPAGKVSLGFALGISMLASGVLLERDPRWLTFGRGMLGGGWAAIYFTTYAMHALPAARVIENPYAATLLLLGVSVLMLLHSMLYRSEAATALAYFITFVTLNLSPLSNFTVISALLLALALMLTAHRFAWFALAVAGLVMTYGTFAMTYEPAVYGRAGVLNGQALLWIYWLVFETYDLIDLQRRRPRTRAGSALFVLNAAGFVGVSVLHEWSMHLKDWALFFAAAAAAYTASAILRARLRRAGHQQSALSGYEAASTIAAGLAAAAIIDGFDGLRMTIALLIEGELIFLVGLVLGGRYLERLGGLTLVLPVLRLPVNWGAPGANWLTMAIGGVLYSNYVLLRRGIVYPVAGSVLLMIGTARQFPEEWVGPIWSAGLLALTGFRGHPVWPSSALAASIAVWVIATYSSIETIAARVLSAAVSVAAIYAAHRLIRDSRYPAAIATILLMAVLEREVQGRLLTIAWGTAAAALVISGFSLRDRVLRLAGLAVFLVCVGKLFVYDLRELDTLSRIVSFIVLGLILLGASWIYTRYREQIRRIL
ncbi:MAG TPA: DUF2339 domain-containing protein [Bryobacteraceae bacterium]|nr:DUF2339 domain-containing protein [Bryobacteraceae bacterium]